MRELPCEDSSRWGVPAIEELDSAASQVEEGGVSLCRYGTSTGRPRRILRWEHLRRTLVTAANAKRKT